MRVGVVAKGQVRQQTNSEVNGVAEVSTGNHYTEYAKIHNQDQQGKKGSVP